MTINMTIHRNGCRYLNRLYDDHKRQVFIAVRTFDIKLVYQLLIGHLRFRRWSEKQVDI